MNKWHRILEGLSYRTREGKEFKILKGVDSSWRLYFEGKWGYTSNTAKSLRLVVETLESSPNKDSVPEEVLELVGPSFVDLYFLTRLNRENTLVCPISISSLGNRIIEVFSSVSRTFGVELEVEGSRDNIRKAVMEAGYTCNIEAYGHSTPRNWKIVTDSSVSNGYELVSPVLKGKSGAEAVYKICKSLQMNGIKVNKSCGFHVHIGMRNSTLDTWKNLFWNYKKLERVIDNILPRSRRNNRFCRHLNPVSERRLWSASSVAQVGSEFTSDRYYVVNPEAYPRHGTVEFRQHSGTVNPVKVLNWILFCEKLVEWSETSKFSTVQSLSDVEFLTEDMRTFYEIREEELRGESNE